MNSNRFFISVLLCILYMASNGQGTWMQKQDFGGGQRRFAVGFTIGNKGYMGTGENVTGAYKDFWEYDPSTDSWTQKANIPGARSKAFAFSIGSKGYVGGGSVNDFWEFDPIADTWTQKANFPGFSNVHNATFVIGDYGYVCTGGLLFFANKELWEYNSLTDVWTQKTDFAGAPRGAAVGFSIGNKGYVGTGSTSTISFIKSKDFWSWDQATDTWTQVADFGGTEREYAAAFTINNFGYVGLGLDSAGHTRDFWKYDPASDTWTPITDFTGAGRNAAVAFAIGCKAYVGTGAKPFLEDFWEYNSGPIPDLGLDTTVIAGSSVVLNATGGGAYLWSTGETTSSITVLPTIDTEYCVTVTDVNGCFDTACVKVFVEEIPCPANQDLSVPNAFSPNNDGNNDVFCLKGWNVCVKDFIVQIYDRWGEEVFQSTNPEFCWDGVYKGKPMDAAVFVYHMKAELTTSEEIIRKGNISLIR